VFGRYAADMQQESEQIIREHFWDGPKQELLDFRQASARHRQAENQ
jgi:hypothetical protein